MLNMTLLDRMIQQTCPGGPVLPPSLPPIPPPLPPGDDLDWLNASEAAVEVLLANRQRAASKSPRFARHDGRVDGPVSTDFWSDESGRVATSRKITNVRSSKVIGFTHSFSMAAALPNESTLEAEAERLFDWAPPNESVHPQPSRIDYSLDGRLHSSTPDLLVVTRAERYLVEIKPLAKALGPLAMRRFQAIRQGAAAQQLHYFVVTERLVCAEPRRTTIAKLRRYALHPVDRLDVIKILTQVPDAPAAISLGELKARLGADADRLGPTVGSLIYWHLLSADISSALDAKARLWKRPEAPNV